MVGYVGHVMPLTIPQPSGREHRGRGMPAAAESAELIGGSRCGNIGCVAA
jgi:hypothetical protein